MTKKEERPVSRPLRLTAVAENNLKGFDLELEHDQLIVFTGVSGSGKTSLAFDTIFREGERRVLSNLGSRMSRLMNRLGRPDCGSADGIRPAIAVDQNSQVSNPSSTVGTLSEISDDLRLLFARFASRHCPSCDSELADGTSPDQGITCFCGTVCPPLSRALFSFNTTSGACPACKGLGAEEEVDPEKLVADPSKSLREGALVPTTPNGYIVYSQVTPESMNEVCRAHGFSIDIPWGELTDEMKDVIFWGSDRVEVAFGKHSLESRMKWSGIKAKPREMGHYRGILRVIDETLKKKRNANILRFVSSRICRSCSGTRLSPEARAPRLDGHGIAELSSMSLKELAPTISRLRLDRKPSQSKAARLITGRIAARVDRLIKLSLGHIPLSRPSATLSSGESRRLRLATQIGAGLTGVCYVFDEVGAGLHQQERQALVDMLLELRDQGNTIIVVEHDSIFRRQADHIVEIGPGSGREGGELVYSGPPRSQDRALPPVPIIGQQNPEREKPSLFTLHGAAHNNLKDISVIFRTGALNLITGLSGAGKTSLLTGCLAPAFEMRQNNSNATSDLSGAEHIRHVLVVDQKPIGRSPRSNPATWCGIFDDIRALFAATAAAQEAGIGKGHFSFNKVGGRCESCEGAGVQTVGLMNMPLLTLKCEACSGNRFHESILEVRFEGRSISEILKSTIDEAATIFSGHKKITRTLQALQSLGLGYLELGQPSPTLSGGEAQRLKLAREMARMRGPETLIILDEPTTGLHENNVTVLADALQSMVASGCTIVAADHDITLIEKAGWLIELGPGSGDGGGQVLYAGPPAGLSQVDESPTRAALAQLADASDQASPRTRLPGSSVAETSLCGVRTNNLKDINASFVHNSVTAVGGLSGSGKSSLVFETLAAEGLGRFAESFSPYLRREIRAHRSGDLLEARGIRTTIAIRSKNHLAPPTSTVGTHSGLDEGLRLVFARSSGVPDLTASHFSFNHAAGACPTCSGIGEVDRCLVEKLVPEGRLSVLEGVLNQTKGGASIFERDGRYHAILLAACKARGVPADKPWNELSQEERDVITRGCGDQEFEVTWEAAKSKGESAHTFTAGWAGACTLIEAEYDKKRERKAGAMLAELLGPVPCPVCLGSRMRPEALRHRIGPWTIADLRKIELAELIDVLENPAKEAESVGGILPPRHARIFEHVASSLLPRARRLVTLGLGHLTLDRATRTLSTGEARRLELARQLTEGLQDICYVLDEPGLGLHAQDKSNLARVIRDLADCGNTVVMVDHDKELLGQADRVIDIGPGPGEAGGRIVAEGSPADLRKNPDSPTGALLNGRLELRRESERATTLPGPHFLRVTANNLRDFDLQINLGEILVLCGVSGSGKSTLLFDVLAPSLKQGAPRGCAALELNSQDLEVFEVDGRAQGRGPFSIVATFLDLMNPLRKILGSCEDSRNAGLGMKDFSFTSKSSRCPECLGSGQTILALDFMPDSIAVCESCLGRRFKDEILNIKYEGLSVAEILDLECGEIAATLPLPRSFLTTCEILSDLGLGHVSLGRRCDSLSAGENARLGIARQLAKPAKKTAPRVFLFDEASRGLHVADQAALLRMFERLSATGAAVIASEHSLDLIQAADRVIELGPGAGRHGGTIVFDGSPAELRAARTPTANALRSSRQP